LESGNLYKIPITENNCLLDISVDTSFDFMGYLQPLTVTLISGSYQNPPESFEGKFISEFSLYYLGAYILSSIARYKPNVWMRLISHSIFIDKSGDDYLHAILEIFMDSVLKLIPRMVKGSCEAKI